MLQRFIVILFLSINSICFAQSELFSYETFKGESGIKLPYRQLISDYDGKSSYPLVVFLHGSGERGDDNERQLKWGVQNFATNEIMMQHHPIVIAPQCPSNMSWSNYNKTDLSLNPDPTDVMKTLIELIHKMTEDYAIDTNRIYITGLSMGGFGTFDALSRYPSLFAAAVPVCGGGAISHARTFSEVPIWMFHGAKDDVVDPGFSRNMAAALSEAGANPGLTIYPETGHFSWIAAYQDKMMMNWLFGQRK